MNIHVSNLDQEVTNEQLLELFKQYGEVSTAEVAMDGFTGQSRGFAYVEMNDEVEGQEAINRLHNFELNNRALTLAVAPPREQQRGSYAVGNTTMKGYTMVRSKGNQKNKGSKRRIY